MTLLRWKPQTRVQSYNVHSDTELSTTNCNRSTPHQSTALVAFITTHTVCTEPQHATTLAWVFNNPSQLIHIHTHTHTRISHHTNKQI